MSRLGKASGPITNPAGEQPRGGHVVVVVVVVVVVAAVVVVVDVTLTRKIKSVVTGQAPVNLELKNTQRKNTNQP